MNFFQKISAVSALFVLSVTANAQISKYKSMLQLTNYTGEKAYIVISLINAKGAYEKTLYMMGPDKKWQETLKEWNKNQGKKNPKLSAITGASVAGGDRAVSVFAVEDKYLNKGYKLRFETAVEDQKYITSDIEIPFTTAALAAKAEGKGYIRYVKISKQ